MQQEPGALSGILDIEAPVAPLATGELWLAVAAALVLLAGIVYLAWRRHTSPRARARRRLAALQRSYDQRQVDGRHAAFELAAILREAYGVSHLSAAHFIPSFRRMPESSLLKPLDSGIRRNDESVELRWHEFIDGLSTTRYAAHDIDPAQLDALFRNAREWLRHAP
jgi:hypothetical protein